MTRKCFAIAVMSAAIGSAQVVYVNASAATGGNGTAANPYQKFESAVQAANSSPFPVTIRVAAGDYRIGTPQRITQAVTIIGSTVAVNGSDGLLTGDVGANTAARLLATAPMTSAQTLLTIGKPGQSVAFADVSGLVLGVDPATPTVKPAGLLNLERVSSAYLHETILKGVAATPGLSTFATTAVIQHNYFSGSLSGAILSGGYALAPASITFMANRSTGNQNGLFLVGTSDGIADPGYSLTASVVGNDLSGNTLSTPHSNGLRIAIKGNERLPGGLTAGATYGTVTATVSGNTINNNLRAIEVDAGFPYRTKLDGTCDPRTFSGLVTLVLSGNTAVSNGAKQLVTFTRQNAVGNATQQAQFKYLHNSSYTIVDSGSVFSFNSPPVDDPNTDPWVGACPDTMWLNNTPLIVP